MLGGEWGSIHEGGGRREGKAALPVVLPTLSYHPENHGLNLTHKCPCSVDSTGRTLWWQQTLLWPAVGLTVLDSLLFSEAQAVSPIAHPRTGVLHLLQAKSPM